MADDLAGLLDFLDLERMPVVGRSAGGPHALAFAACHPDRVTWVGILSGACPLTPEERAGVVGVNRDAGAAASKGWDVLYAYLDVLRTRILRDGIHGVVPDAGEEDLVRMSSRAWQLGSQRNRTEALRQGAAGWADEALAIMTDWDFDLDHVEANVTWWHGARDLTVPLSAARRLATSLPTCGFITLSDEGHQLALNQAVIHHLLGH